jgi:amidase
MKKLILSLLRLLILLAHISAYATENVTSEFSLEELTIDAIHTAIKSHKITCEQLVKLYFERIKRYNLSTTNQAPINAFTGINPNIIEQAKLLDAAYAPTQHFSGSLHCIPVILKDNIDSYDSATTSGSLALLGNQPTKDAFLVAQLRKAGAIILGNGGMDELAAGMFGISSRSGRIGNVYDTSKNPGGSSGGPATAISANFALIGIGTDNSGSIRIPAAFNGIYGLRPSTGLISQSGIFPSGNLDGTAGPLTRTVQDLALVLDVIAKKNQVDQKTVQVPRVSTYTIYLKKDGLNNKRIGIVRQVGKTAPFKSMPKDVTEIFYKSLNSMKQSGAHIVDNIKLSEFNNHRELNMSGMRQDINDYLSSYPSVRQNFKDLCNSNRIRAFGKAKRCIKFFESMPLKFGVDYKQALETFAKNRMYVEKIMQQNNLDALLIPISTVGIATYEPYEVNTWLAPVSSNSGLPGITMNIGYTQNKMPFGVELIGKQFAEGSLIEIAYAHEQNSQPRIKPKMPEQSNVLQKLDIPAYNNLITSIGYRSYMDVLKANNSNNPSKLAPNVFKAIVNEEINRLSL